MQPIMRIHQLDWINVHSEWHHHSTFWHFSVCRQHRARRVTYACIQGGSNLRVYTGWIKTSPLCFTVRVFRMSNPICIILASSFTDVSLHMKSSTCRKFAAVRTDRGRPLSSRLSLNCCRRFYSGTCTDWLCSISRAEIQWWSLETCVSSRGNDMVFHVSVLSLSRHLYVSSRTVSRVSTSRHASCLMTDCVLTACVSVRHS